MRTIFLAVCLFVSTALAAQQARFRLERIVVEGSRVHEHVVRSESRLLEERLYTEDDVRQALYRIRRLPFVTDAVYRLEPGVTAGSTVVVIRILDTTPLFYDATLSADHTENGRTFRGADAAIGGRLMLDDLGVLEGRVQTFDLDNGASASVTYRAYGLFDTSAFAVASVEQHFGAEGLRHDPSRTITAGWPLTRTQTLVFTASRSKTRRVTDFDVNGDDDDDHSDDAGDEDDNVDLADRNDLRTASLRWLYETYDDPLFATRGMRVEAGPFWSESVFIHETWDDAEDEITGAKARHKAFGFQAAATAYRPLGARNVLLLSAAADATRSWGDGDYDRPVRAYAGRVRGGVAHDFHSHDDSVLRPFRARLELGLSYRTLLRREGAVADVRSNDTAADASFVMRHRWGTLRLTGSYDWR